jgi:hypothetical protein
VPGRTARLPGGWAAKPDFAALEPENMDFTSMGQFYPAFSPGLLGKCGILMEVGSFEGLESAKIAKNLPLRPS